MRFGAWAGPFMVCLACGVAYGVCSQAVYKREDGVCRVKAGRHQVWCLSPKATTQTYQRSGRQLVACVCVLLLNATDRHSFPC